MKKKKKIRFMAAKGWWWGSRWGNWVKRVKRYRFPIIRIISPGESSGTCVNASTIVNTAVWSI